MAYTALTTAEVASGKANSTSTWTKVKDNFTDHEARLLITEAALGALPPICFDVVGVLTPPVSLTQALTYRLDRNVTFTACRLFVPIAGSAGSVEIDVEYKRGGGSWTSILSTAVSQSYTAGDGATTSGTLTTQTMNSGDLIRLNINSVQTAMEDFSVYIENEVR